MVKKLLFIGLAVSMVACKGGDKAPVMETSNTVGEAAATEHVANIANQKLEVEIESVKGAITISELLSNRKKYSGKKVTVKGQVTKFNAAIMNKNWVHIQDGTEHGGEFDLTITTEGEVRVGAQVVFTGTIALDKDFGYGYTYSTLMEDAEVIE